VLEIIQTCAYCAFKSALLRLDWIYRECDLYKSLFSLVIHFKHTNMKKIRSKIRIAIMLIVFSFGLVSMSLNTVDDCLAGTNGCSESNCPTGDIYTCCTGTVCYIFFGCETYYLMKGPNDQPGVD